MASTCTMADLTSVLVRTSSLFEALYTTSKIRVFLAIAVVVERRDGSVSNYCLNGQKRHRPTVQPFQRPTSIRPSTQTLVRTLGAPGEVARLEPQRAELQVPPAAAHGAHALLSAHDQLRHGGGAACGYVNMSDGGYGQRSLPLAWTIRNIKPGRC